LRFSLRCSRPSSKSPIKTFWEFQVPSFDFELVGTFFACPDCVTTHSRNINRQSQNVGQLMPNIVDISVSRIIELPEVSNFEFSQQLQIKFLDQKYMLASV
jgi:hypothetical protein